jgi:hypothetical protein
MKLIANPEELKRLSMTFNDHTTDGKEIKSFNWTVVDGNTTKDK